MPRELAIGEALIPGVLAVFVLSLVLFWLVDWLIGRFGLWRSVWYPALFRLGLFVCVFCGAALLLLE